MKNTYSWEQTGISFEHDLVTVISEYSINKYGKSSVTKTTVKEDLYEGTDCKVLDVPIDITVNFSGKNRTWRSRTEIILDLCTIKFGVRYGNGKVDFEEPVLVIGVESHIDIRTFMGNIIDSVKKQISKILDTGMDIYIDKVFPEEVFA